jgi:hypothetical protein
MIPRLSEISRAHAPKPLPLGSVLQFHRNLPCAAICQTPGMERTHES